MGIKLVEPHNSTMRLHTATLAVAAIALIPFASADELRLKDGSVIKGKILGIEQVEESGVTKGVFSVESPSLKGSDKTPAKIPQELVSTFSTDSEFLFATAGQTRAKGKVESTATGVQVSTPDGLITSNVENIKDGWTPGSPSPDDKARAKLERRWLYTADVSIIGKTGNGESIGANGGLTAVNKGPDDEMKFYAKMNYAKAKGPLGWSKTADDLHAGLEYTSYFARPMFWYVRSDNGYDKVQQITFFSTDAAGLGTLLIDKATQHLSVRGGLSYRFESYKNNLRADTSSPGLDAGLHHDCEFEYFKMVNDLSYTPAFNDFSNFIAIHDSYIEMPLADGESWKLRLGVNNQYRSKVVAGTDRLATTYYLKFVLNWK